MQANFQKEADYRGPGKSAIDMSMIPKSLATQHEAWTETGLAPAYRKVFCPRDVFLGLGQYRVNLGLEDPLANGGKLWCCSVYPGEPTHYL